MQETYAYVETQSLTNSRRSPFYVPVKALNDFEIQRSRKKSARRVHMATSSPLENLNQSRVPDLLRSISSSSPPLLCRRAHARTVDLASTERRMRDARVRSSCEQATLEHDAKQNDTCGSTLPISKRPLYIQALR